MKQIKRALISCWDKSGLIEFAALLKSFDVEIISSGGTAKHLIENGFEVTAVSSVTGYPEVLGGRVKTLHPLIHAAILADDTPDHLADLAKLAASPIDLVVVNLYPFVDEAIQKNLPLADAIEYIDIGGPTLLRAAAKNFKQVASIHDPGQYEACMEALRKNNGALPMTFREECARKVFFYTSWYDGQIQSYFYRQVDDAPEFPEYQSYYLEKKQTLRYGENPHQQAAVYQPFRSGDSGLAGLTQLWGKPLSYNNYADVYAAYAIVLPFEAPGVAIIKHTNPCGAALSNKNLAEAFDKAFRGDSLSAFGGIVACNRTVDRETAEKMSKIFFECIIAPGFDDAAREILQKKKNLRLLALSADGLAGEHIAVTGIGSTFLLQQEDRILQHREDWKAVTDRQPDDNDWEELTFAWQLVKHVKSNAIIYTRDRELYGVGAGQMSRVDSVNIAEMKAQQAGRKMEGLVMASDAFFPFRDGIDAAAKAGVTAIIQPGGSIRDEEVIAAANEHNISMVFTGIRHFKH